MAKKYMEGLAQRPDPEIGGESDSNAPVKAMTFGAETQYDPETVTEMLQFLMDSSVSPAEWEEYLTVPGKFQKFYNSKPQTRG